jgi:hypothetical protein
VILVGSLPGGQEISARLDRDFHAQAGSELQLYLDLERVHLFEADTGRAIAAE